MNRHQITPLRRRSWCSSRAISCGVLTSSIFNILLLSHTLTTAASGRQSCNTTSVDLPTRTIAPENMTFRNINMAFLTNVGNNGQGKLYGGAFFLAMEELNQNAADRRIPVHFNWTFRDTGNLEAYAMKQMSDLYCAGNVTAFIGPDAYCKSAGLMATAFNIPYIAFDCSELTTDSHNETSGHLMVNTKTYVPYISGFIVAVLQHYKWKSFWLIRGQSLKWQNTAKMLIQNAAAKDIIINGETDESANEAVTRFEIQKRPYRSIIQATRHKTRVYVFLGEHEPLLAFLKELKSLGVMDSGEYVVVAADDSKLDLSQPKLYMFPHEKPESVTEKDREEKLLVFQNVLMVSPLGQMVNQEDFENKVYERNTRPPINLAKPPPGFDVSRPEVPPEAYRLYDATMFFGRTVMALMSRPGVDPENATEIISYLRCRHHDSIHGNKLWIHKNGESVGSYFVQSLGYKNGEMQPGLQRNGNFSSSSEELVYKEELPVTWISGHPPVSDPVCGFSGEKCPSSELAEWQIFAIIISSVVIFIAVVIVVILLVRHYMYEQKLERLAWKIEREEIQLLNAGQFRELMTPARPRKKDSYSGGQLRTYPYLLWSHESDPDIIGDGNYESEAIPVGVYKGSYVVVKQLTRKHIELTRALKKQMQLRKELTHENINRFIGACIEIPHVYIVTQYCPRKSLQDILKNDDSPLDDMFITSLVQDLIRGMSFIHESEFGYHGNLKSSNCLVDSRWTLKISDFGLSALGPPPHTMFQDEESFRELLWTAPELLRYRRTRSSAQQHSHSYHSHHPFHYHNSSQHSNNNNNINSHISGSQKGDVYSFAIILYELYGKAGPWGKIKMTNREIIERLIIQTAPMIRPDTSTLTCESNILSLIQDCWSEDSDQRPDFKYTIRSRFKPIQQGFLKSNIFDNMLAMMEKYANNLEAVVAERTEQLRQEKKMTENLLLRMLPRSVAEKLKRGQKVEPEQFEQVSIYFSDIVGFTEMSADSTPMEVVDLLNNLYTCFDSIIEDFDVYKVETIGDAYMVVSGLPIKNGDRHAGEIASMSLLLLEAIKQKRFRVRGNSENMLKIRIGIHSGPCCAGVVGLKMPRYCLFGDTVNTANRLESTGQALKIHCSAECKKILDKLGGYHLEERGYTEMKGKGSLLTYFLVSEDHHHRDKRISSYKKSGEDGRCVSSSNLDYSGKIYSLSSKTMPHVGQGINRNHIPVRDSLCSNDRSSWASSHNMSMDSTWSEVPEETALQLQLEQQQQQPPLSPLSSPTSPHQFTSSTLPRANGAKYNNAYMSPIAEDPASIGETMSSPLEKTVSFPNTCLLENNATETDSLLEGSLGKPCIQLKQIPQRRSVSSRSVWMNGARTPGWGGGGGRENMCVVTCHVDKVDGSSPETVL